MPTSPKSLTKPRRMWFHAPTANVKAVAAYHVHCYGPKIPCLVIPLTPECIETLALKLASVGMTLDVYGKRGMWKKLMRSTQESWLASARTQLASIGIKP